MILYRTKHYPTWKGRMLHMAEGLGLTGIGGLLGLWTSSWYQGVMLGAFAVIVLGFLWETATRFMAKLPFKPFNTWGDTYGDYLDWLSFIVGTVLVALPTHLLSGSRLG